MGRKLTETVRFDFIRYANCWEDADILLEGLKPSPGSRILSVGSAGDNSFSLLATNPALVVAVDVNNVQLYLLELKKTSIQQLPYEQLLAFLGFNPCKVREELFNDIKKDLTDACRCYWENNILQIKNGVISEGKFEKYLQLFSSKILPWIHSKKKIEDLMKDKSQEGQEEFYNKQWNTWKWKLLFKIFFSRYVMGKYGRDPAFLNEVKGAVGTKIFKKAEKHLKSVTSQKNFILRYSVTGSFGGLLPHYLRLENFELIKSNLHKLKIYEGYAEDAAYKYGKFDHMNLSNIFEYMDETAFAETALKLIENINANGKMAYWNLMVPRMISKNFPEKMEYLEKTSLQLSAIDKGFFYNKFIIDKKI